jgi:hypothetical protein
MKARAYAGAGAASAAISFRRSKRAHQSAIKIAGTPRNAAHVKKMPFAALAP